MKPIFLVLVLFCLTAPISFAAEIGDELGTDFLARAPRNQSYALELIRDVQQRGLEAAFCSGRLAADLDYYVPLTPDSPVYEHQKGNSDAAFCEYLRQSVAHVEFLSNRIDDVLASEDRFAIIGEESFRNRPGDPAITHEYVIVWQFGDRAGEANARLIKFREFYHKTSDK